MVGTFHFNFHFKYPACLNMVNQIKLIKNTFLNLNLDLLLKLFILNELFFYYFNSLFKFTLNDIKKFFNISCCIKIVQQ